MKSNRWTAVRNRAVNPSWTALIPENNINTARMVQASGPIICTCNGVDNKIVFCALHESAESLLATCEHLRNFLRDATLTEQKDQNMTREIILPYLDGQIAAAEKKG